MYVRRASQHSTGMIDGQIVLDRNKCVYYIHTVGTFHGPRRLSVQFSSLSRWPFNREDPYLRYDTDATN